MRSRQPGRPNRALALVAAVATLLAACGSVPDAVPTAGAASGTDGNGDIPSFSGPYAADFERVYTETESAFVRDALMDEEISDAEFSEMTARLTTCLADNGIEFGGYDEDGAITTSLAPNPDDTHDIFTECSKTSGEAAIGALYSVTRRNPDNLDVATITAECLVKTGAVPPQYDADDYTADTAGRFSDFGSLDPELQEALTTCSLDPLSNK